MTLRLVAVPAAISLAAQALPLAERFVMLALVPQLVFWVGFTIVAGTLAGSLAALAARPSARRPTRAA